MQWLDSFLSLSLSLSQEYFCILFIACFRIRGTLLQEGKNALGKLYNQIVNEKTDPKHQTMMGQAMEFIQG